MNKITYLVSIVSLSLGLLLNSSCTKESVTEPAVISAGFECGWGSGADSVLIYPDRIVYKYFIYSQSLKAVTDTSRFLTSTEWNEIKGMLDADVFNTLKYNECNICVDGCDEWIIFCSSLGSHKIRYGKGKQISEIRAFQEKLESIRNEFVKTR